MEISGNQGYPNLLIIYEGIYRLFPFGLVRREYVRKKEIREQINESSVKDGKMYLLLL